MTFTTIDYDVRDNAGWITLNRPEAMNAIDPTMVGELRQVFAAAAADEAVRVIVLTGEGDAFCAGADLKHALDVMVGQGPAATRDFIGSAYSMFRDIGECRKPLVAAVNGIAAAGGIELILCCDLVIAAERARIGDAHANYGLLPGGGSSIRLPRKIGPARAKYLLFSGEFLPAETLMEWGLVNKVVPDGELVPAVEELIGKLTAKSPLVLSRMKWLVDNGLDAPLDAALRLEPQAWEAHAVSEDLREGLTAFTEKRPPRYQGR